jgi:hypothetical protein
VYSISWAPNPCQFSTQMMASISLKLHYRLGETVCATRRNPEIL